MNWETTKFSGKISEKKFQLTRAIEIIDSSTLEGIRNNPDQIKPRFLLKDGIKTRAAVSCWVSAKRTRSYPFSRVLRTLYQKDMKKITTNTNPPK